MDSLEKGERLALKSSTALMEPSMSLGMSFVISEERLNVCLHTEQLLCVC